MVLADQPVGLPGHPAAHRHRPGRRERLGVPARIPGAHVGADAGPHAAVPGHRAARLHGVRARRRPAVLPAHGAACCPDRRRCSRSSCSARRRCRPSCRSSYAESMHLFLLFAALLLLVTRRYLLLIPVAAVMALTRPSGLAFALLLLLHLIHRIATRKRDPLDARSFASIVAVGPHDGAGGRRVAAGGLGGDRAASRRTPTPSWSGAAPTSAIRSCSRSRRGSRAPSGGWRTPGVPEDVGLVDRGSARRPARGGLRGVPARRRGGAGSASTCGSGC